MKGSHQGRQQNHGQKSNRTGGRKPTRKPKYVAPTLNHGDVLFTSGTTKDAAEFKDTV